MNYTVRCKAEGNTYSDKYTVAFNHKLIVCKPGVTYHFTVSSGDLKIEKDFTPKAQSSFTHRNYSLNNFFLYSKNPSTGDLVVLDDTVTLASFNKALDNDLSLAMNYNMDRSSVEPGFLTQYVLEAPDGQFYADYSVSSPSTSQLSKRIDTYDVSSLFASCKTMSKDGKLATGRYTMRLYQENDEVDHFSWDIIPDMSMSVTTYDNGSLKVSWNNVGSDSYTVRCTAKGNSFSTDYTTQNTSMVINDLKPGTTYTVRVSTSTQSTSKSVTVPSNKSFRTRNFKLESMTLASGTSTRDLSDLASTTSDGLDTLSRTQSIYAKMTISMDKSSGNDRFTTLLVLDSPDGQSYVTTMDNNKSAYQKSQIQYLDVTNLFRDAKDNAKSKAFPNGTYTLRMFCDGAEVGTTTLAVNKELAFRLDDQGDGTVLVSWNSMVGNPKFTLSFTADENDYLNSYTTTNTSYLLKKMCPGKTYTVTLSVLDQSAEKTITVKENTRFDHRDYRMKDFMLLSGDKPIEGTMLAETLDKMVSDGKIILKSVSSMSSTRTENGFQSKFVLESPDGSFYVIASDNKPTPNAFSDSAESNDVTSLFTSCKRFSKDGAFPLGTYRVKMFNDGAEVGRVNFTLASPLSLNVSDGKNGAVQLDWGPMDKKGEYTIRYKAQGDDKYKEIKTQDTNFSLNDLQPGKNYDIIFSDGNQTVEKSIKANENSSFDHRHFQLDSMDIVSSSTTIPSSLTVDDLNNMVQNNKVMVRTKVSMDKTSEDSGYLTQFVLESPDGKSFVAPSPRKPGNGAIDHMEETTDITDLFNQSRQSSSGSSFPLGQYRLRMYNNGTEVGKVVFNLVASLSLQVQDLDNGSLQVSWNAMAGNPEYTVSYQVSGDGTAKSMKTKETKLTIIDLQPGKRYDITVSCGEQSSKQSVTLVQNNAFTLRRFRLESVTLTTNDGKKLDDVIVLSDMESLLRQNQISVRTVTSMDRSDRETSYLTQFVLESPDGKSFVKPEPNSFSSSAVNGLTEYHDITSLFNDCIQLARGKRLPLGGYTLRMYNDGAEVAKVTFQVVESKGQATGGYNPSAPAQEETSPYLVLDRGGKTVTGLTKEGRKQKDIKIPEGVTAIDVDAFALCDEDLRLTLPSTMKDIPSGALTTVGGFVVDGDNPTYMTEDGVLYSNDGRQLIAASKSVDDGYAIPSSVTTIADYAFAGCVKISYMKIPSSVRTIGSYAFVDTNIENYYVSKNNRSFIAKEGALYSQDRKTLLAVPYDVESFEIPSSVTTIEGNAFATCYDLTSLTIERSVEVIEDDAFINCDSLKEVRYMGSKKEWGAIDYPFPRSVNLTFAPPND